jgi:hypothetical protein
MAMPLDNSDDNATGGPPDSGAEGPPATVGELDVLPGVSPLGDGVACLSESRGMSLLPSAIYLMLDSSGSMDEATGAGRSKWQAIQRAVRGFLAEARDSDLLLGLQFFPLLKPGTSFVCTSQADCGSDGGPCFLSTCRNGADISLCTTDADCPGGPLVNPCVRFGLCSDSDPSAPLACVLDEAGSCGADQGTCQEFERTCTNATECNAPRYATPAVQIGPVASTASAIDQALTQQLPQGLTPTVPALQGALDHARAWALSHPGQNVATLLATDGLPTECGVQQQTGGTTTIDQVLAIAAAGVAGDVSVRTYVIGVFQPGDGASINNVNAIAQAGGTEKAATIDASGEVEQGFLEALRSVRAESSACVLPLQSSQALDFARAELQFDAGNGAISSLPYVEGLLGCAAKPEGWYYDTPPAQGQPHAVQLCPNVCQLVRATPAVGLLLEIGCAT